MTSSEQWMAVKALLDEVIELEPAARERKLLGVTADPGVLAELRALLAASDASTDFLTSPAASLVPLTEPPLFEQASSYRSLPAGTQIGAFRIDELMDRGGQGEVYGAVRVDGHFEQRVALKLLRPEAAGQIERFQSERQILAGLEHPGIARLIDGGLAPDGRPFMAMEFVTGQDLKSYCEARNPSLAERLALFRQVCDAVAYAHRNLVVHRDLKPGNILVTADRQVKLLDFGIAHILAEASDGERTEAPLTMGYAAPEQIQGLRPTTATDVYALGVVLFELLTGRRPWIETPHGLPVSLRVLGDDTPVPSSVAAASNSAPVPSRTLRGDLDAIVLKAMRRQPADRYESASALWDDLARHLAFQPVRARVGNAAYRFRRFVRRNRWPLAAAASVMLAIVATSGGIAWQARKTALERDVARAEAMRAGAVRDYVMLMFRTAGESGGALGSTAKQLLDNTAQRLQAEFDKQPSADIRTLQVLGDLYAEMDDYESAATLLTKFIARAKPGDDDVAVAEARLSLAAVEMRRGNVASARAMLTQARAFWIREPERYQRQIAEGEGVEATILRETGRRDEAIALLRNSIAKIDSLHGSDSAEAATRHHNLGVHLLEAGRIDESEQEFSEAMRSLSKAGRERSVIGIAVLNHRAAIAYRRRDLGAAESMWREAITLRRALYGPSAALALLEMNLGRLLLQLDRAADALPVIDEALGMAVSFAGNSGVQTIALRNSRAVALIMSDRADEAESEIREALAASSAGFGANHPYYAMGLAARGRLRLHQGRLDEAETDLAAADAIFTAAGDMAAPLKEEVAVLQAALREARATPKVQ